MNNCLNNSKFQDDVLNQRIEARKYKIESTRQSLLMKKNIQAKLTTKVLRKLLKKIYR